MVGSIGHIRIYWNAECLKCGVIEKEMNVTGALIFCPKCMKKTFKSDHPAVKERRKYLKWLKVYEGKPTKEDDNDA